VATPPPGSADKGWEGRRSRPGAKRRDERTAKPWNSPVAGSPAMALAFALFLFVAKSYNRECVNNEMLKQLKPISPRINALL
jgi:hypothetical protein